MTNHPSRSSKLHHFIVDADPQTGEWLLSTLVYGGMVDADEFHSRKDTEAVHYDQADPEAFPCFADAAGVELGKRTVALTMNFTS